MNTFINWLGSSFAPKVAKAMDKKIIRTLSGALMANVPILLLGSIISIYNLLAGYVSFLPDLSPVYNFSFGIMSLTLVFLVGYHGAKEYGIQGLWRVYRLDRFNDVLYGNQTVYCGFPVSGGVWKIWRLRHDFCILCGNRNHCD